MVECCGVHLVGPDDLWVRELEVDVYSVNFGVTYVAQVVVELLLTLVPLLTVHQVHRSASPVTGGVGHWVVAASRVLGHESPAPAPCPPSPRAEAGTASLRSWWCPSGS